MRTCIVILVACSLAAAAQAREPRPMRRYDYTSGSWDFAGSTTPLVGATATPAEGLDDAVRTALGKRGYVPATDSRETAPTTDRVADYYPASDCLFVDMSFEGSGRVVALLVVPPQERQGILARFHSRDFLRALRDLDRQLLERGDWVAPGGAGPFRFVAGVRERLFGFREEKALVQLLERLPPATDLQ